MKGDWISASELGEWEYCPQSWALKRKGVPKSKLAMQQLEAGNRAHRRVGRRTERVEAARGLESLLLLLLAMTLLVAALVALGVLS